MAKAGATHVVTSVLQAYRHLQSTLGIREGLPGGSGSSLTAATENGEQPNRPGDSREGRDAPEAASTRGGIASATPPPPTAGDVPVLEPTPKLR